MDLTPGNHFVVSKTLARSIWLFKQTSNVFGRMGMTIKCDVRKLSIQTADYEFRFIDDESYFKKYQHGYHNNKFITGEWFETEIDKLYMKIHEEEQNKFKEVFDASKKKRRWFDRFC